MPYNIELIIVRNPMAYSCDGTDCQILNGDDLFELVTSIYPKGQPLNTYWYHEKWDTDNDVTPTCAEDIVDLNEQGGTIYIVTYPAGPETWIPILVSAFITVASVLLMPVPVIPANSASAPPSPNNALSQRTNVQRKGGRIADIYGQVWSVPDLGGVTYTVYINHRAVEMSYYYIGRGWYLVTDARDDRTPINQIFGSGVLIYNPDSTPDDTPAFQFGSAFTADEAKWSRMGAKRYTSVNGQTLVAPDAYLQTKAIFKTPNIIQITENTNPSDYFAVGKTILIENADGLESANGILDAEENIVKYNLSGQYTVLAINGKEISLQAPGALSTEWQKLADNVDLTVEASKITLSAESQTLYQGFFYTNLTDHDSAYVNLVAAGLYDMEPSGRWKGLRIYGLLESEIVDVNNNPIAGTLHTQVFSIASPEFERYGARAMKGGYDETTTDSSNNRLRESAAVTVEINNPFFSAGKRLRFRIARTSNVVTDSSGGITDEIKIKDFYGVRRLTADDYPMGFATIVSKTLETEGALSIKERKLHVLAQRLERDWRNNDALIPSKRIDDIIYEIAIDPVTSNLTVDDLNMAQITAEVDAQIAYFGTDLCAQFCGTFDNKDITTEEMIQTVAMAGFFIAYRIDNKVCLRFEKPEPYPVATFNSHSITPGSFDYSESFGPRNDYDGVEVVYTDPVDDAKVTLRYPEDGSATNPDTKNKELVGVRNKVQAHMHLMRRHWKNQHAYKTCSFTAADESGIVIPTDQINVADQNRADTQQGAVEALQVNEIGQVVLTLSDRVDFGGKAQATVFVQTVAGIVDNIRCTPSDNPYEVILNRAPSQPISTAWDAVVRATYQVVLHDDLDRDNYIVTTKEPGDNPLSHRLSCINYTNKYYANDKDFIDGLIA